MAIGQGALTATPLQLARAIGGFAIGGVWHRPHLVKARQAGQAGDLGAQPGEREGHHRRHVRRGQRRRGTGGRARLPDVEVCGKTGSAQLASNDLPQEQRRGPSKDMRDNAWFEGFAPRSAPEIVVVALFEHGEHGQFAAPIVRDVMKAYFDKKTRLAALEQEKQAIQARVAGMTNLGMPGMRPPRHRPSASAA